MVLEVLYCTFTQYLNFNYANFVTQIRNGLTNSNNQLISKYSNKFLKPLITTQCLESML